MRHAFHIRRRPGSLLLVLLLCLAVPIEAQQRLTLNMRGADIQAVIQWLADATGRTIVVDPRVRGEVTILARDPVSVGEAYQIVTSALQIYGFAAIERDGVVQIVPQANVRTGTTRIAKALAGDEAGPVNYTMRLTRLSAADVANALKPLVPSHAHLSAFPDGNVLLIADEISNVRRIVALAEALEEQGDVELEVVTLQYASAEELEPLVKALAGSGNEAPLQTAVDRRSNALVLAGDAYWRDRARDLLERLDQPLASANTQVIYLNYLDAAEVLPILRGLTAGSEQREGAPGSRVSIEASESTNALIVSAPPAMMTQIEDVVRQIDIRRAQVLVEAVIAEVSMDLARELGVQWQSEVTADGTFAATNFGRSSPIADPTDPPLLSLDSGLTVGYFANSTLRALLNALQIDEDSNILSTPSIVTLDNNEAEILVGSNVPFITGQATGPAAGTSNPFTTIEREDIGITLKVTPQINRGDAITLDVLQEVETLSQSQVFGTQVATDIVTDKRSIQTKVLLDDNDILVLGGLIEEDMREIVQKVPLLGDIPLLGRAFQSRRNSVSQRNLMVFIHTRIITDMATAEEETRRRYELIRQRQLEHIEGRGTGSLGQGPALPAYDERRQPD